MGLVSIGSVTIAHGDPDFSWTSDPTAHGLRDATIGGSCSWAAAKTLSETFASPVSRQTIAGKTGIPQYLVFDDSLLGSFTGYYLVQSFDLRAAQKSSLAGASGDVGFSMKCVFVGDLP